MELEVSLLERVRIWESLSRWERSELGRDLRRAGLSYGEIMAMVPVKKSTLATWCREVELTEEQIEAIGLRHTQPKGQPRNTQRKRRQVIDMIRAQAMLEAEHLQNDPFWASGVAMYWAEGCKTNRRLEMAHSEPEALRLFMAWARHFFAPGCGIHCLDQPAFQQRRASRQEMVGGSARSPDREFHQDVHQARRDRPSEEPSSLRGLQRRMRRSTDAWITALAWIDFVKNRLGN